MPFGELNETRTKRLGILLDTIVGGLDQNRRMGIEQERQRTEREGVKSALQPYLATMAGRKEKYTAPQAFPQSPAAQTDESPQIPTEEKERTIYPSREEQERSINEVTATLLSQSTGAGTAAAREMNALRPRGDNSRTEFEAYAYGTPEEKKSARDYLSLKDKKTADNTTGWRSYLELAGGNAKEAHKMWVDDQVKMRKSSRSARSPNLIDLFMGSTQPGKIGEQARKALEAGRGFYNQPQYLRTEKDEDLYGYPADPPNDRPERITKRVKPVKGKNRLSLKEFMNPGQPEDNTSEPEIIPDF